MRSTMLADQNPNISAGSHGHPEMCHRPCVYIFKSGFCHLGSFCDHCHLPHEGPSLLKLDKKQRTKLREMSREDLMALLLPHIRYRVAVNGLGPQTRELLALLEEESVPRRVVLRDLLPRELDRLNRVLSRLPFSALAAWQHMQHAGGDFFKIVILLGESFSPGLPGQNLPAQFTREDC